MYKPTLHMKLAAVIRRSEAILSLSRLNQPQASSLQTAGQCIVAMVWLRSGRETGDDTRFLPVQGSYDPPPSSICLKMRVLPCRVFRPEDEILYSPFMGFIVCTMGFNGEGKTLHETADDTCRKLVSYMERRLRGKRLPPYHEELSAQEDGCWKIYHKLLAELDFEEHEAKGEMEWGTPTDFAVFVQFREGTVNKVGWQEEGSKTWFVWTMPGLISLS